MRSVIIAGVSTVALAVAGCSMFHSRSSEQAAAGTSSQPSYSSNAPSGTSTAPTSSSSQAAAPQSSNAPSQTGMNLNADEVKQAQQKLKDDGDYKGAIDGKIGPRTEAAVKEFQQKNGLQQTGMLDAQTTDKLGLGTMSGSSTPPSTHNSQ